MHKAFSVHMLNEQGKQKAGIIASVFDALVGELERVCPAGRELAIVLTKLEEACFFAKKAMASDDANGTVARAEAPPDYPVTADGDHVLVSPPTAAPVLDPSVYGLHAGPAPSDLPLEAAAPAAAGGAPEAPEASETSAAPALDPSVHGLQPSK
jgi:hypothetical protein